MPTVVATPGAGNANSYCTVAEADAYHETHLYAAPWTAAAPSTKETAVIMATRLLDSLYEWAEWPTSVEQALFWPRVGLLDVKQLEYLGDDEIPLELKYATAEFARQLLLADRTSDNTVETQGIRSLTAGPVSLSFKDTVLPKIVPDAVVNLLPSWWGRLKNSGTFHELLRS